MITKVKKETNKNNNKVLLLGKNKPRSDLK